MTVTNVEDFTTVRFFIPKAAAKTKVNTKGDTLLENLKKRVSKAGGFTAWHGKGGWTHGTELIEENVTVGQVNVRESDDLDAYTLARVNAHWIHDQSDEEMVLVECGGQLIEVKE